MMTATLSARSPLHNDRVSPPHAVVRHSALGSEQLGASDSLLHHHARDGNHREAAVVELLGLHLLELRRVGGLEAHRIEAEVARRVVRADGPQLAAKWRVEGEHREDLDNRKEEHHRGPEGLERRLLEGDVRRDVDRAAEERVELLSQGEAQGGEHGNAGVLQLHLAVEFDLALRRILGEAHRIEEAQRPADAGHVHHAERRRRRRLVQSDHAHSTGAHRRERRRETKRLAGERESHCASW
mmetsp:Transcript_14758/g.33907  ORF Transcript_14758/g.33907 Transcript_14758/m.33907 type:complete len:241 (+) Transcript_14758:204-926(+)